MKVALTFERERGVLTGLDTHGSTEVQISIHIYIYIYKMGGIVRPVPKSPVAEATIEHPCCGKALMTSEQLSKALLPVAEPVLTKLQPPHLAGLDQVIDNKSVVLGPWCCTRSAWLFEFCLAEAFSRAVAFGEGE